jgi:hypothetical protein
MQGTGSIKLALMVIVGFLFIDIFLTGKLGSILGSLIDPANMQEVTPSGSTNNTGTASGNILAGINSALTTASTTTTANMQLSPNQIAQYAYQAGFRGTGLINAIAIALAESGGQTHGKDNVNTDQWKSRDRGLYQINSHWHPEVTDQCAYNPICASGAAFRISAKGSNFGAWSTFNSKVYLVYVPQATIAAGLVST